MDRSDVLIVGGGPAGSTLASGLVDRGLDVVVLDRARFPRDKVCAGWITPAVVHALQLDLADYTRGRVLQPIHGFAVGVGEGRQVRTPRSAEPVSYGILRREFDHYLLERSGARLALGRPLKSLERRGEEWVVNGEVAARLVVGAGGHFCPVARELSHGRARVEPVVAAQEVEFEPAPGRSTESSVDPEVPELFFCDDLKGYGWVFRKGDHLNVGLGREDPRDLPAHVSRFREFLVESGRIPATAPAGMKGHAYRLYRRGRRRVTGDGLLLVGDAASLAYSESGEGIRPAIESGLIAAEVIMAARGDYRRGRMAAYDAAIERRFGPRGNGRGPAGHLPAGFKAFLARRLLRQRWFVQRMVIERWFLHRQVPELDDLST